MYYIKKFGSGCRIDENYKISELQAIFIENKFLSTAVVPDKGADIIKLIYKPLDIDFMWKSPLGFINPKKIIQTSSSSFGNFMDYYEGGWQDIFPNGGPAGSYGGAEFGLHGEVSLLPWNYKIIEESYEKSSVKFWVKTIRYPFKLEKIITIYHDKPLLRLDYKLINESPVRLPYLFGEHIAIGEPFLDNSCVINLEADAIRLWENEYANDKNLKPGSYHKWPFITTLSGDKVDVSRVPAPDSNTKKMLFIEKLFSPGYSIFNQNLGLSFNVRWDTKALPYIWYWLESGGTKSYPWFGRTYNIALEPFNTAYPGINKTIEKKRAYYLEQNQKLEFYLEVSINEIKNLNA